MIDIRNIKRKYAFKHVLFGKALGYFTSMGPFHNYNNISPADLFFSNRVCIIKTCRFGLKSIFEKLFGCFASVLILIANKQNIHADIINCRHNLNLPIKKIAIAMVTVFLMLSPVLAAPDMIINEMMYNPEGSDNNKEFIELYAEPGLNLSGWVIADSEANDTLELLQFYNSSYYLIVEQGFDYSGINASIYSAGTTIGNNLNNEFDSISVYHNNSLVCHAEYNNSLANGNGNSLEFVNGSWLESAEIGGTPGRENTADPNNNGGNTNSTNTTITGLNVSLSITTDKEIYNNGEKVRINLELSNESYDYIIEYWVEDLHGVAAKDRYNTTNTNQKSWTPNIDESDKSFLVSADLYIRNNTKYILADSKDKLITVVGDEKPAASSIAIKEIYLGADESIAFGEVLRVNAEVYKGDSSKSVLEAWIENEDNEKISYVTKSTLYSKFTTYDLTIPIQIKPNCNEKWHDNDYVLVFEGLDLRKEETVKVEGLTSSLCSGYSSSDGGPDSSSSGSSDSSSNKLEYDLVNFNDTITIGEEFSSEVLIENDGSSHIFRIWSYVYRSSRCYSCLTGEREENMEIVEMDPGESRTIRLINTVDDTVPGDYRFKVKINKDNQKTDYEITKDVIVVKETENDNEDSSDNAGRELAVANLLDANKTEDNKAANMSKTAFEKITGSIIYQSSSEKAKKLALYLFGIALIVLLVIVLAGLHKKN